MILASPLFMFLKGIMKLSKTIKLNRAKSQEWLWYVIIAAVITNFRYSVLRMQGFIEIKKITEETSSYGFATFLLTSCLLPHHNAYHLLSYRYFYTYNTVMVLSFSSIRMGWGMGVCELLPEVFYWAMIATTVSYRMWKSVFKNLCVKCWLLPY